MKFRSISETGCLVLILQTKHTLGTGGKKREAGIRHRPTVILFSRYDLKGLRFCAPTGAVHLASLKPSSYSPAFNSPEL